MVTNMIDYINYYYELTLFMNSIEYLQMLKVLGYYFLTGILLTFVLYVFYGFAMSAKRARDDNKSQRAVVILDTGLSLIGLLLDLFLNLFFYSVLMLDFRKHYWLTTISARMSRYSLDTNEREFRRNTADFFAALLDGKDPGGDHITGENKQFKWLD